ncbi:hypothetical protein ACFLUS_02745 [Chloroflexota bacterium]
MILVSGKSIHSVLILHTFTDLVSQTVRPIRINDLPDELHARLENVAIVVEDWPSRYQLAKTGLGRGQTLKVL